MYIDFFCEDELDVAETFRDLSCLAGGFVLFYEAVHDVEFLLVGVELQGLVFVFEDVDDAVSQYFLLTFLVDGVEFVEDLLEFDEFDSLEDVETFGRF